MGEFTEAKKAKAELSMDCISTEEKGYIDAMISKENMKRVYYVAIAFFCLQILFLVTVKIRDCFSFEPHLFWGILLGNLCVMGSFTLLARYVIKERIVESFSVLYYLFWGLFMGEICYLSLYANTNEISLVGCWLVALVIGLIPLLSDKGYLAYMAAQILLLAAFYMRKQFAVKELFCLFSWGVFSILLSRIRFKNYVQNLIGEKELKDAIALAESDPMTKLLNRRGLERSIYSIWPYCLRQKLSVAVLMIDIDNFKKYNDSFGHLKGDECIKAVAREIKKATRRKTDLAARVGGEEFLVFLTGANGEEALKWANNLKENIESLEISHSKHNFLPIVTVSMGLCCVKPHLGEEFSVLCKSADVELYKAKENGRACIYFQGKCFSKKEYAEYMSKYYSGEKKFG